MLEGYSKSLDYCTYCPRLCQSACPVLEADSNESHAPWGLMQTMNLLRKGELELDEEMAALSYQCLSCKACTSLCEHEIEVPPILHEIRKEAVQRDLAPPEVQGFLAKFHKHNNPFSKDLLLKLKGLLPKELFDKDADVTYFSSCTTIAKSSEVIEDTFDLFKKLKIDFVSVYPETIQCCGYPLISAGMEDEFIDVAEVNFHALKKYKTIVTGSPACAYTLKETYKKYDFSLESKVVTINKFLEPYIHNINYVLKKEILSQFMYHDPCYLSRYLDEIDLPRELLSHVSGYEPMEFFNHGKKSGCSGQGGCYSIVNKDVSDDITKNQLEEVYEKDVKTLVTQCPSCIHKFRKNSKKLEVKDLVSFLNDCIEGTKE